MAVRSLFEIMQGSAEKRQRFYTSSGSPVKDKFIMEVTSKGYPSLRKVGERNVYDEIQSYREGCDLAAILQSFGNECPRYDPLSLEAAEAFVNDFSNLSSLGDLVNDAEAIKQFFRELPLEVRNRYDDSVHRFARDFNSTEFIDNLREAFGALDNPESAPLPDSDQEPDDVRNTVNLDSGTA